MLETRHLQHVVALDRHRNFNRASEALRLTQPALTRSIQNVEDRLGAKLFDRGQGELAPTVFGQALIDRAKAILAQIEDIDTEFKALQGLDSGRIAVGSGALPAATWLYSAVGNLVAEHPNLKVRIAIHDWRQLKAFILQHDLDLAVADLSDVDTDARFTHIRLEPVEVIFYGRPEHPLVRKDNVSASDLLAYPWAIPKDSPYYRAALEAALQREQPSGQARLPPLPSVECVILSGNAEIVAKSGLVGAATAASIARHLESGAVQKIPTDFDIQTNHGIFYLKGRTLSPASEAMISCILKENKAIPQNEARG